MKRHAKQVVDELERRGYEFTRQNTKGLHFYANAVGAEVAINPGCTEQQARDVLKRLGVDDGHAKRSATAARERQAADRDRAKREVVRLEKERAAIVARKVRALGGIAARMTEGQTRAIERRIEEIDREMRQWRALMTEVPASAEHSGSGRPRHRSGGPR